ncbi:MAG: hypothetical protein PWQ61_3515 [Betaproteobacteria bacterium]|nr:hypothetical protein [Betaproteobacteria bacterium]
MSNAVAVKISISIPAPMYSEADKRRRQLGYSSFSAYVQYLISTDLRLRPPHVREEVELPDVEVVTQGVVSEAVGRESGKIGKVRRKPKP